MPERFGPWKTGHDGAHGLQAAQSVGSVAAVTPHIGYAGCLACERGPRDGTDVVDLLVQGGLLGREQATALLTPLRADPALLAGG